MANIMSITSIIPNIIFGIVLILAWLPVIVLTEKNNKGNNDEYKLLEDKIKTDLKLSNASIIYSEFINTKSIGNYTITKNILNNYNNNLYVKIIKKTKITDNKGNISFTTEKSDEIINKSSVMNDANYIYLASQNEAFKTTANNDTNSNITYELTFYSIPADKNIIQINGLQQYSKELDMDIYDYEFGPEEEAIKSIKNRKLSSNTIFKWLGRIGTFIMLLVGLSLLISPLTFLNQLGDALPGPLKLLAIPGRIISSLYQTFSFFGSLILTLLMTFLVWSIINMPYVSILVGSLLVGLILYFNKKK
jgi:hypothetical protein